MQAKYVVELSKTFETKKKILGMLKERSMTITELSHELNLSTQTIGQHITELQEMGAIERVDNEHFKKLKVYKINEAGSIDPVVARYIIGAVVIIAVIGVLYLFFYYGNALYATSPPSETKLYAGNSIKVGNVTVQLSGIFSYNGVSEAAISVYNKGVLTNKSTVAPGGSETINSSGTQLMLSVGQTYNSPTQQWATIILQSTSSTINVASTTIVVSNSITTLYPPSFPN